MPNGAEPGGSGVGDEGSWVRFPASTAKALMACAPVSTTHSVPPLGPSRASSAPTLAEPSDVLPSKLSEPSAAIAYREMLLLAVLTVKRNCPSWLISTQHGAVWKSGKGDEPIDVSVPSLPSLKAETVPLPAPPCALETNSCVAFVGRNSLPNGPGPCAGNGELGAAVSRPSVPTVKLSISEVPTRAPTSLVPSPLNSTSPGEEPSGRGTVEPASGRRWPPGLSVKPA